MIWLIRRWVDYRRRLRAYRHLIAERDRLILQGVNPDALNIPTPPRRPFTGEPHGRNP